MRKIEITAREHTDNVAGAARPDDVANKNIDRDENPEDDGAKFAAPESLKKII